MAKKFPAAGVFVTEIDQSEVATPASTSIGAMVGKVSIGRANQRQLITSDKEFYDTYGVPVSGLNSENAYYAAGVFLNESNQLWFVRTTNGDEKYANLIISTAASSASPSAISNLTASTTTTVLSDPDYTDGNKDNLIKDIEGASPSGGSSIIIGSVGPGTYGNSVGVAIITCASSQVQGQFDWGYKFDDSTSAGLPAVSANTLDTLYDKIYKIKVYVKPSEKSSSWFNTSPQSISATPVEEFLVSNWANAKDKTGSSIYAPTVINGNSKYIYVKVTDSSYPNAMNAVSALANGADSFTSPAAGVRESAWSLFSDREKVDVRILIDPTEPTSSNDVAVINYIGNIASSRQDCISVGQVGSTVSSQKAATSIVNQLNTGGYGFNNPSYTALYAGYSKVYDRFTDKQIYLPNSIFGAALMARTDRVANTWNAPAGPNRGIIGSALDQLIVFNESQVGYLMDNNINAVKFVRGPGHVMWSQKTAQRKASALDRINVRRLLIYIETSLVPSLVNFLFEPNTDKVRSRVSNVVDSFMSTVKSGQGVSKYSVVCDSTNNTSDDIDNHQLNVDLYIQPVQSIEFISLRVTVTRSGVTVTA